MGMTLKELLTKGEGTLTAGEAKTLASQCRMDVETLYTLLEERGIKILDDEADGDTSLDVEGIMAEVESAEANSDELGLGDENEDDPAEENPADLKAAMDELLDDPVKNYLKQIGQIPLLSAEQEVDLSKRIHAGAEAAHILQADRQKYGAPEYIKKNSARFSFEEDENSRSYTEDLDEDGNTKSSEDDEEKAAEEEAMEAVENGPLTEERRQELLKIRENKERQQQTQAQYNKAVLAEDIRFHTQRLGILEGLEKKTARTRLRQLAGIRAKMTESSAKILELQRKLDENEVALLQEQRDKKLAIQEDTYKAAKAQIELNYANLHITQQQRDIVFFCSKRYASPLSLGI